MFNSTVNNQLSEPHFDDERTLMTAKPVVPLESVESDFRKRRRLVTATVTVAVALGTLSATFLYFKWTPSPAEYSFVQNAQAGVYGTTEAPEFDVADAPEQVLAEPLESTDATANEVKRTSSKTSTAKQAETSRPVRAAPRDDETPAETEDDDARVSRRVDRWEERRERRAMKRRRNQSNSDLMRIDQIFEGTPRP